MALGGCVHGPGEEGCMVPGRVHGPGGGCIPACTEADPPPMNRMTNGCKNITLSQTSFAGSNYNVRQIPLC